VYLPSAPVVALATAFVGRTRPSSLAASIRAPAIGPPDASVTVPVNDRPPTASTSSNRAVAPAASSRSAAAAGS
jgi:hypothetical protein